MAILNGFDKQKKYIRDECGDHKLVSEWTHSDSVEFDNGETLTEKTQNLETEIDGKLDNRGNVIFGQGSFMIWDDLWVGRPGTAVIPIHKGLHLEDNDITAYDERHRTKQTIRLNPNGGTVTIMNKRAVTFESLPSYVYNDDDEEEGDPNTFKPNIMVNSENEGQIVASNYTIEKSVPSNAEFTDQNVRQIGSNLDANLRILLSGTADDTSRVEAARKDGHLTYNPNKHMLTIDGDFEVSGTQPHIDFHLNSSTGDFTGRIIQREANKLDFVAPNSTWATLQAAAFSVQSSKYVKKNIEDVTEEEANKIMKLRPVTFDYINGADNQCGLIAEEVLEVMPEMVDVPKDYTGFDPKKPLNIPGIDYSKFVPYLIKMIQIQQTEIDELKRR